MDPYTADLEPQGRYEQTLQRVIWTGAVLNGGALVAMCNIIANVADPDAALRTLAPAMNTFALGLLAGGLAIQTALRLPAIWASVLVARSAALRATERQKSIQPAVSEWPMDLGLARLIHGDQAETQVRALYADRVKKALDAVEESAVDFACDQKAQAEAQEEFTRATRTANILHGVAVGLAILGFGLSVDGTYAGRRLQPLKTSPQASVVTRAHEASTAKADGVGGAKSSRSAPP